MIDYLAYSMNGNGKVRNDDRILVNNTIVSEGEISGGMKDEMLAIICDGVGGTRGGGVAAERVVSMFMDYPIHSASGFSLTQHILSINKSIILEQKKNEMCSNMATTLAGIILFNNRYLVFNLGDTRIYEVKNNTLSVITRDHVLENTEESNCSIRGDRFLTSYIGGDNYACNPSIIKGVIGESERLFLICSDGIYKYISNRELREIMLNRCSLKQKTEAILKTTDQNESMDDRSIVLINYSS